MQNYFWLSSSFFFLFFWLRFFLSFLTFVFQFWWRRSEWSFIIEKVIKLVTLIVVIIDLNDDDIVTNSNLLFRWFRFTIRVDYSFIHSFLSSSSFVFFVLPSFRPSSPFSSYCYSYFTPFLPSAVSLLLFLLFLFLFRRVRASRNHVTQSLQGTLDPEHNHQLLANGTYALTCEHAEFVYMWA